MYNQLIFRKIKTCNFTYLACSPGKYGPDCINSCDGHCLNNAACNITTGKCDAGCKPGYTGDKCNKSM